MLRQFKQTFTISCLRRSSPILLNPNYPAVINILGAKLQFSTCSNQPPPLKLSSTAVVLGKKNITNIFGSYQSTPASRCSCRHFVSKAAIKQYSITGESPALKKRKMTSITTVQRGSLNKLDYRLYYRKCMHTIFTGSLSINVCHICFNWNQILHFGHFPYFALFSQLAYLYIISYVMCQMKLEAGLRVCDFFYCRKWKWAYFSVPWHSAEGCSKRFQHGCWGSTLD